MKIRQLVNVISLNDNQRVKVHDTRTQRTIESEIGWVFGLDYEYEGFNYDEVNRILNLKVYAVTISGDWLNIWAQ